MRHSRFKIQIHLFIKITWFQHWSIYWHWCRTMVELYPCLLFINVDMEILIKAWSRCHKDHHKWKRSDSPCNTGCITVFRVRFNHMWPRAIDRVDRVIYIPFSWPLMRTQLHWVQKAPPESSGLNTRRVNKCVIIPGSMIGIYDLLVPCF